MKTKMIAGVIALVACAALAELKVVGYVTGLSDDPSGSQIRSMTHLNFCFVTPEGTAGDIACSYSLEKMARVVEKAKLAKVKTLISFGGGGVAITGELMANTVHRQKFVSNLVQFVEDNKLDGIDNDWEPDFTDYGSSEAQEQIRYNNNVMMRTYYNTLVSEIRDSLDSRFGKGTKLLTAAVGTTNTVWYNNGKFRADNKCWPDGFWEKMDFINLMTYGSGAGGVQHGDYSVIFGPNGGVKFWSDLGVSKRALLRFRRLEYDYRI